MTHLIRAELGRILRRRTVVITAAAVIGFALIVSLTILSNASDVDGPRSRQGGATLAALTSAGGATEAFAVGAGFLGFFVFVVFIAAMANEFSGGTFRALLLRDPHRMRLMVSKLSALLLVTAGALALAEVATAAFSALLAPANDIATTNWFTVEGLGQGVQDFVTVFAGIAGWAIFGTMLAVIFRSAPLALGVGFAWAGPFENISIDFWDFGYWLYPGQVLGSLIQGGTAELALGRALLTGAVYVSLAAAVSLVLLNRRDVTNS